jgi:hypothetical protein
VKVALLFVPVSVMPVASMFSRPCPTASSTVTLPPSTSLTVIAPAAKPYAPSSATVTPPAGVFTTGASLTATTVTVEAMASAVVSCPPAAVPPLSRTCTSVTVRAPPVGVSTSVFW